MRAAPWITVTLAAACSHEAAPPPAPVAADAPIVTVRPPRAAVRSCAAASKPLPTTLDPRIDVGHIGGVSWLFGYADGDAVLAHLGPRATLVRTPVPLHNARLAAREGPRIWLYAPDEGAPDAPSRWTAVDVADPEAPITGAVQPVTLGETHTGATAFAVGSRRALVVADDALIVIDTAARKPVRASTALGPGFAPVHASCDVEHCAVIGVSDEGGGPTRRLVVHRAGPDGAVEREQLAPGWISEPYATVSGGRTFVLWSDDDGPKLRALDARGRPVGPVLAPPDAARFEREALLPGELAPRVGLLAGGLWSVAAIDRTALGPLRELPGANLYRLGGVALDDGLVWIGVDADVSYDEMGPGGPTTHSWRSRVVAGFLSDDAATAPTSAELAASGGGGRGGLEVFTLFRPGAAAALIVPRGDASSHAGERARMVPLRTPCP